MNEQHIDEEEIRKALAVFKGEKLFEIRIHGHRKGDVLSGYFTSADKCVEELRRMDQHGNLNLANVFYTINLLKPDCYGRIQKDQICKASTTTSDSDVQAYEWLLIDLDPKRPSDTSSTDDQLQKAVERSRMVFRYLKGRGFPEPVMAYSGNGVHLQYSVALINNDENKKLIESVLKALSLLFSDDDVEIDTSVFNPARICKLYGTMAQKGANTERQPHRMSRIEYVPKVIETVSKAQLQTLADDTLPKVQKPAAYNNYNPAKFDLEEWLNRHGISYRKKSSGDYEKFILDCCPFDSSHKAPDAMVTRSRAGELGFKCLHNSCSGKHWRDFRLLFEPDAYDHTTDSHIEDGYSAHKQNREIETTMDKVADLSGGMDLSKLDTPRYLSPTQISQMAQETDEFIETGITALDKKMRGLIRGGVSVLSGLRGGSKSTFTTQISLNVIERGGSVLFHSFEMPAKTVMRWFHLMAAGRWNTVPTKWENAFFTKPGVDAKIDKWLDDRLYIYDNNHGNDFEAIYAGLIAEIAHQHPDLIILDNLMALDISGPGFRDIYQAQTAFINKVVTLAKQSNTHIIVVAHPRKANGFLRLDDISGTGNIGNAVNNAFIIHRNNEDFRKATAEMFHWKADNPNYLGSNIIEVAKDREYGTQDFFIPLYFEPQTRRLRNTSGEAIHYSWETEADAQDGGFLTVPEELWKDLPFAEEG